MIEHVLHDLNGIEIFGIISICLFFVFFTGMLFWAGRLKKSYLNSMQDLPLDGGEKLPTRTRPMNNENEPNLLDHEYDGIRELDNKLPRWWVWLFYGSIIFAAVYLINYHTRWGKGQLMAAQYEEEMKIGDALKAASMTKFEASINTLDPSRDPAVVERGHQMFLRLCAPCHRADAGGLVGPNLCDDYWIHGSNFSDNVRTIWNGVPAKGMITWKNSLKPDEVYTVASYIYTLRGTHPVNPKPPENQAPAKTGPSEFE